MLPNDGQGFSINNDYKVLSDNNLINKRGIYMIKNEINNRYYIGSTRKSFKQRWYSHLYELKKETHGNILLQNAVKKYGINNFKFFIIEIIDNEKDIIEREQYYLDNSKCMYPIGYNLSSYAVGNRPSKFMTNIEKILIRAIKVEFKGVNFFKIIDECTFHKIKDLIFTNKYSIEYLANIFNVEKAIITIASEDKRYEDVIKYIENSKFIYTEMGRDSIFSNKMKSILFGNHNCHGCIYADINEEELRISCKYYNCDMVLSKDLDCIDKVNSYDDYENDWCMQEFHCRDIDSVIEKYLKGDIY